MYGAPCAPCPWIGRSHYLLAPVLVCVKSQHPPPPFFLPPITHTTTRTPTTQTPHHHTTTKIDNPHHTKGRRRKRKGRKKGKGTYFNDKISAASRLFMRGSNPPL